MYFYYLLNVMYSETGREAGCDKTKWDLLGRKKSYKDNDINTL